MIKMVPAVVSATASYAEKKVFQALQSSASLSDAICFHSLNLPRHATKRCCEIDFLVVAKEALLALEVKGGGIERNAAGQWFTLDRNGARHALRESPFTQSQSNFFALMQLLKDRVNLASHNSCPMGWGVIFPDCAFEIETIEWDPAQVVDQPDMAHFSLWMKNLAQFYQGKSRSKHIDAEQLKEFKRLLRPEFERVPSLAAAIGTAGIVFESLTEDQCRVVDILANNPRVICTGGAGTGKTFLALEMARRFCAAGKQTLFCCSSPWLKNFLDSRLSDPNLEIMTMDRVHRLGQTNSTADVLIVDEGQDVMNIKDLDCLGKQLDGGLDAGCWCVFCDTNNQSGLIGNWEEEAFSYLCASGAMQAPLTRNCRNTKQIVDEVNKRTGCAMGKQDVGEGPPVVVTSLRDAVHAISELENTLKRIRAELNYEDSRITILSPLAWDDSVVSQLKPRLREQIVELDDYSMRSFPPRKVNFARIGDFKGLENDVIIIVDLDQSHFQNEDLATLYVGMSRARAYLIVHYRS